MAVVLYRVGILEHGGTNRLIRIKVNITQNNARAADVAVREGVFSCPYR
ncbi:hypothetical protein KCE64_005057 [Salmonella enterica subsp. enterica serovar Hvittingfoss]|nr:hypothetical protein [Salmonella enterica]EHL2774172.1 hypothetical protein [Salmonella enterica subsp. enterica serovar Hvittingfoss]EHL2852528.1 hypothetical protein [Salmonella enterica subsp. enterica serovar Hvittingfoss]